MAKILRSPAIAALLLAALLAPVGAAAAPGATVVHLSHGSDDVHAVTMALSIGALLAKRPESRVTLFLDLEGVRVADRRTPAELSFGHGKSLGELYDAFVAAGGEVLLCGHCAGAAGVTPDVLRKGARIGSEAETADWLLAADRILDY